MVAVLQLPTKRFCIVVLLTVTIVWRACFDLDAPSIINNEKRMLQESVDALFDNGRRGRPSRAVVDVLAFLLRPHSRQGRFPSEPSVSVLTTLAVPLSLLLLTHT